MDLPELDIQTFLQKALTAGQEEGQHFTLPEAYTYRDFDHVVEVAYVRPMLKEMHASFQHKTAVSGVVKEFLEKKTFALPRGVALSFDALIGTEDAPIAFGNLARPEVIAAVRAALLPKLKAAINAERPVEEAELVTRRAAVDLGGYQAVKRHVLQAPRKSAFTCAAMDSSEERRVAMLLDGAVDVTGWVYNHRSGVGYSIAYDHQGYVAHYFPDFIARAKIGAVFHNFIIEVKGRLDDRDKKKANAARRYCEILTEYDKEPWHYVLLIENEPNGRSDVTWWEQRSVQELGQLLRRHEGLPLYPDDAPILSRVAFEVVPSVPDEDRYVKALPVYDLAVAAGAFSASQSPEPVGWARVRARQDPLNRRTFVARVLGESMEPGVRDGSWAIFRAFPAGSAPSPTALDGRRVVVELRDEEDPDTGGRYTLKRWRVARLSPEGHLEEVELCPDNHDVQGPKAPGRGRRGARGRGAARRPRIAPSPSQGPSQRHAEQRPDALLALRRLGRLHVQLPLQVPPAVELPARGEPAEERAGAQDLREGREAEELVRAAEAGEDGGTRLAAGAKGVVVVHPPAVDGAEGVERAGGAPDRGDVDRSSHGSGGRPCGAWARTGRSSRSGPRSCR